MNEAPQAVAVQLEREELLPVIGAIVVAVAVIIGVAYFLGNLLYQIP